MLVRKNQTSFLNFKFSEYRVLLSSPDLTNMDLLTKSFKSRVAVDADVRAIRI